MYKNAVTVDIYSEVFICQLFNWIYMYMDNICEKSYM